MDMVLHAIELAQNKTRGSQRQTDEPAAHASSILDFAFIMLDPNPAQRATTRQLVAMINAPHLCYIDGFNYCSRCHQFASFEDLNVPFHSIFQLTTNFGCPEDPEVALKGLFPYEWEVVKEQWLEFHMWWPIPRSNLTFEHMIDEALFRSLI
jgi:hypothetical protein